MKTLLITILCSVFIFSISAQKVIIKDNSDNTLLEIEDEGIGGSILLPLISTPGTTTHKLYNTSGRLFWNGAQMGTIDQAGGWKISGLNLTPINLSSKVGIGTDSPTRFLEVHKNTGVINNINPIAWFRTVGSGNSAGSIGFQNTISNYYTIGISQTPDSDFSIAFNSNISLSTDLLRLTPEGYLGLGTVDPQAQFHLVGDARIEDTTNPSLQFFNDAINSGFVGTINSDMYLSNNIVGKLYLKTQNISRLTVDGDGDVGIGTTSPSSLLHVQDDVSDPVTLTLHNLDDTGSERLFFGNSTSSDALIWVYGSTASSNTGKMRFTNNRTGANYDWVVNGGIKMAISNDGNLGVGTSSPSARAHILHAGTGDAFRVDDSSPDASPFVIQDDGDVGIGITGPLAKQHIVQALPEDAFRVDDESSDTSPFIIKSGGRTGIGLTTPSAKTHIVQSNASDAFRVDDTSGDTSPFIIDQDGDVGVGTESPTAKQHIIQTGSEDAFRVDDGTGDTSPFVIKNNGNVGIGTTTVSTKLHVNGFITLDDKIVAEDNSGLKLCTDDQITRITITDSGDVGIGTLTPSSKLDINGDVEVGDNLVVDGELQRSSTGTANMIPIAYGMIDANSSGATILSSTGNVSITRISEGTYGLDITGFSVTSTNAIIMLTPKNRRVMNAANATGGYDFELECWSVASLNKSDVIFSFVVYAF